ncbi:MAG: transcriptional repressor [Firmicutes bacterium]|nr:transcriptional repressor [Bacillota bacterium]
MRLIKRNTIQKKWILEAIKELNTHAAAEEVYDFIAKSNPTISKGTVYRNMSQMAKDGELLNIGSFLGATHYDHNLHEHAHFVCNVCGMIFDVECDENLLGSLKDTIVVSDEYKISSCNVSFGGVCAKCGLKRETI